MSKIIKYSKLNKKVMYTNLKKIDTILLDVSDFYNNKKKKLNESNIIIANGIKSRNIKILGTKASNICFQDYANLGDITIPFNFSSRLFISFDDPSKVKRINIVNDKNTFIELDNDISNITIVKTQNNNIVCNVSYKNRTIDYEIDVNGNIIETKRKYIITQNDIKENSLDMCPLSDYEYIYYNSLSFDTLIINKSFLENIEKLNRFNDPERFIPYHNRIDYRNLIIRDDDEMRLTPNDIIFENIDSNKIIFKKRKNINYISIENNQKNHYIVYIDKNNNIKVINKNDLLNEDGVEDVFFDFINNTSWVSPTELIVIKYKNYYKVLDFEKEYHIDLLFFKLLYNYSDKYFLSERQINYLCEYDLVKFICYVNNKKIFLDIYNKYIEHKSYLEKLKKIGFTDASIKYLLDKKIDYIITPNMDNLNNISETEINCFNEIGNDYVKKKVLKSEK